MSYSAITKTCRIHGAGGGHICTPATRLHEFSVQAFPKGGELFSFEYGLKSTHFGRKASLNVYVDEHNNGDALNISK